MHSCMCVNACERAATWAARAELKLIASEPCISVNLSMTERGGTLGVSGCVPSCPSSISPSDWKSCVSSAVSSLVSLAAPVTSASPQQNSVTESLSLSAPLRISVCCSRSFSPCWETWFSVVVMDSQELVSVFDVSSANGARAAKRTKKTSIFKATSSWKLEHQIKRVTLQTVNVIKFETKSKKQTKATLTMN